MAEKQFVRYKIIKLAIIRIFTENSESEAASHLEVKNKFLF